MRDQQPAPVVIPRENVNDETATLVAWAVGDATEVEPGRVIAQVETSKAVVDLEAPAGGVLKHAAAAGAEVPIGAVIGWVFPAGTPAAVRPAPAGPNGSPAPRAEAAHAHASPAVARLVAEHKVDLGAVCGTGRAGRVTKADVLAHLETVAESVAVAVADTDADTDAAVPAGTRISAAAREAIRRLGLDEAAFHGRGLVRARDVVPQQVPLPLPATDREAKCASVPAVGATGVPTRTDPLSRAKRTEGRYLRAGAEATLPSTVSVTCPTRGFFELAASRPAAGGSAAALIVAEAARLLRKYPVFNAYHGDGVVHYYEEVNVGFAIDDGRGLRVPVVRDADKKSVPQVADELRNRLVAYVEDQLTVESLAGGTFTVTDLSSEGVTMFQPLITRGQSAILGVCAEALPPGGDRGAFSLVLSFDHQLAEGRTAARFLTDLRGRLAAYETAFASTPDEPASNHGARDEPCCSRCGVGVREATGQGHALVQSVSADGSTRLLCRLCWEGWI